MTPKEFFRRARRGRKWSVQHGGAVSCAEGFCPLGAVAYKFILRPDPQKAAKRLGWKNATLARRIADAADFPASRYRPWLLENLGIK